MVWVIILIVILLLILFVISKYNLLVKSRNNVKEQFSQIDVQLKKRSDLIPNLVETVKGYAKHESETLDSVIKARNLYADAKTTSSKIEASKELTNGITKIMALAEAYPELKANTNFETLQGQLKEIEDKIAYARQFYNDSVLIYNNLVEVIPTNIIASMFGFKRESFFEADQKERENVKVSF